MSLAKIFPFLVWFKLITKESVKADFLAGLTGAVIALPQDLLLLNVSEKYKDAK